MGDVIPFPAPLPVPSDPAAVWAAAIASRPAYLRAIEECEVRERETTPMGAICPPRLRLRAADEAGGDEPA